MSTKHLRVGRSNARRPDRLRAAATWTAATWTAAAAAVAAASAVGAPALHAQDTEWNRYTIEGLPGVHLTSEIEESCEGAGLTPEAAVERAEGALTEAEIPLLTREEMLAANGLPELRVQVQCETTDDDRIGFAAWVRLYQSTQMIRDNQITLSETVTWYTSDVGVVSGDAAAEALGTTIAEQAGVFAAAFQAVHAEDEEGDGGGAR